MKQKVFNGALNRDIAPKFLREEDYVGASNIIFQASKDGNAGLLRRYPGFAQATASSGTTLPTNPSVIGGFENRTTRLVYFFVNGTSFDGIYKYNPTTNEYTKVIVGQLNLSASNKVTGIAMIGDYLFWTDNLNQPRMINVTRNYTTFSDQDITLIKPAPLFPLDYTLKKEAVTYTALTGNAYQFSYRYVYLDNQVSVIAPYADNIYCPDETELVSAIYLQKKTQEIVPRYLKEIQMLVRRQDEDNWRIWTTLTPEQFNGTASVQFFATQNPTPYVDANTLVVINGEIVIQEFFNNEILLPEAYPVGTEIIIKNYVIDPPASAATTPQIRLDIYKNDVLWQRFFKQALTVADAINFSFSTEPNTTYRVFSYSVANGLPLPNPFIDPIFNGYKFSGDQLGLSVPINETIKSFESVPLKSKALEIARDRVFLGNNTEGYNLYKTPTLKAVLENIEGGTTPTAVLLEVWVRTTTYDEVRPGFLFQSTKLDYYLKDGDKFYFFKTGSYSSLSPPAILFFTFGDYFGTETTATVDQDVFETAATLEFDRSTGTPGSASYIIDSSSISKKVGPTHSVSVVINVLSNIGDTKFKNRSQYQIGIVFYDRYLRNQGVYTNENCLVSINDDYRSGDVNAVKWEVASTDPIPLWAESYQIVRTDNLTKSYFIQGKTSDIYWVYEDNSVPKFSRSYRGDADYIEIDISGAFKSGLKYNFSEGDLIELELASGIQTYKIQNAIGSRIRIAAFRIPDLEKISAPFPVGLYFEIYSPIPSVGDLIFYECGVVHQIINSGTASRSFSSTTGYLKGDVYVIQGDTYDYLDTRNVSASGTSFDNNTFKTNPLSIIAEAPNEVNSIDAGWVKSLGRLNAVLQTGQVVKETAIRHSNRFIQGTKVNGTSNFEVNDEKQLSIEVGQINKLQLTSKAQQEGTVMLAICQAECVSLYLGETQFVDNINQALLGSTVQVIGTVNVLNAGAGTIHPESVVHHNGRVWWWDFYNSRVLRYDPNGIRDLSALGMRSYFYGKGAPTTAYDPFHDLFFIGFGSDMLSYDESANHWRSFHTFVPQWTSKVEDFMISFHAGVPWKSNSTAFAYPGGINTTFYEFFISFPLPQILDNISLAATEVYTWVNAQQNVADLFEILVTNESGQQTSLLFSDFDVIESTLYAQFYRDINSQGGLRDGEVMRSDVHKFRITIKGNIGFESITINDTESSGH